MKSDLVLFAVIHQQKRGHDLPLKSVIPRANPPPPPPAPDPAGCQPISRRHRG